MKRFIDWYLDLLVRGGSGGGGGSATLIDKNIAENGTFNASDDNVDGYKKVVVDVPNSYGASDEGKVVSNGALVAQTSRNITANGTVDTTLNDSVNVAVEPDLQSKSVSYSQNGSYTVEPDQDKDGLSSVAIVVSTPAPIEWKDVNFIDYDGTLVHSYTKAEFLALTEMPANPSHAGLTAQGWNWPIADAKTYVTNNGRLIIGQSYITDDDKTRIYITVESDLLKRRLGIGVKGTTTVDWGDGSATEDITGTSEGTTQYLEHTYAQAGDYVITMTAPSDTGKLGINGNNQMSYLLRDSDSTTNLTYRRAVTALIKKIEIGKNVVLRDYALQSVIGMQTITLPVGRPNATDYQQYIMAECISLRGLVLPDADVSYKLGGNPCYHNYGMTRVSLPRNITMTENPFNSAYGIEELTCPAKPVAMPNPAGGSQALKLKRFTFPVGITSITDSALNSCGVLTDVIVPEGVTSIGNGFCTSCSMLRHLSLPSTLRTIGGTFCQYASSLTSLTLPALTSIGTRAFMGCANLQTVKMLGTTPPTIDTTVFSNTTCTFEVPYSADHSVLETYQTASNWTAMASRIVEAPAP